MQFSLIHVMSLSNVFLSCYACSCGVIASMKGQVDTSQRMQDLEDVTADISSAFRARIAPVQDTQDIFARINLNAESGQTPQHEFTAMPSTELRRNVTRRRSNERARDSVGSTSVPIPSLISRRPKERQIDMVYANEAIAVIGQEKTLSYNTSVLSPAFKQSLGVTRRLIPNKEDDPVRHKALKEMWVLKKALEEDIDEALGSQNSEEFHQLVQQHKQLNQEMVDILRNPSDGSPTLEGHPMVDMESIRLWLAYDGDEISVVVWPQMTVEQLIDRVVAILCERGVIVMKEQVILRHDGETLGAQTVLSDYHLSHDDIVEILVSRCLLVP